MGRSWLGSAYAWIGVLALALAPAAAIAQAPPVQPAPAVPPPEEAPASTFPPASEAVSPPSAASPEAAAAPHVRFDPATGAEGKADDARGYAESPGIEDEDVALFLPRAVLFIPKLVVTAVFWLPQQGMKLADHYHLVERATELLYFDRAHNFGWTPRLSYQSGYGPTGGAELFHKSLFGHQETIEVSGVYGGRFTQAYRLAFAGDRVGGTRLWLDVQGRYEAEPGLLFAGIGIVDDDAPGNAVAPRLSNRRSYLAQERVLGLLRTGYTAGQRGQLVKFGASAIFNHRDFSGNSVDKRQLAEVYDPAQLPGFEDRVVTLEAQANLVVDLRKNYGLDSRGAYMEGFFGGVPELDRYRYWHYGFELAYTFDLYRATRLLRLRVALEAVEGETSRIPFTDLPRLGGVHRMRGYLEAQFRDKRASVASVEYHYPIHRNVHGQLFIDAGYVNEHYRELFKLDRWKLGAGGGLLIGGQDDIALQIDFAYGDGFHVYVSTDLAQAFDGRSDQL